MSDSVSRLLLGVDIGGTKCAVILSRMTPNGLEILSRKAFATRSCHETIAEILSTAAQVLEQARIPSRELHGIGVSCGGPLDSRRGLILSPPNLPGWDSVPICRILTDRFHVPAALHNDANASALAEWTFGAGRGSGSMAFLTFGTGMGAGLILNGKIWAGANDNAGEIGHVRMEPFGPVGYGKAGSFEGFCSGGGIRQLAQAAVRERLQMGQTVPWLPEEGLEGITAAIVARASEQGDALARGVMETSARYLGRGLSLLIDLINPEVIVIGSIFQRNEAFFRPYVEEVIRREALPLAAGVCRIVPSQLGDAVGDYAAISVAASICQGEFPGPSRTYFC